MGKAFKGVAALDQDLLAGGAADRGADGQRGGETEGARAADNQQRDRVPDGAIWVEFQPNAESYRSQSQHDCHEPTRNSICLQHHRRSSHRALLDQPHQAPDTGVLAGDQHLHQQPAIEVDSAGVNRVADRDRLGL